MRRPGVMAPPDLYERPASSGLLSPSGKLVEPIDPRIVLWAVAAVLGAVELFVELTPG
jgi:hypothetical protein